MREIEPYFLLLKGEEWYVQGYCGMRQDFRTFKILRMKHPCIIEERFELRLAADYLLSFGKKCECLEPAAMRKKMFEVSKKVYELYSNTGV